MANVSALVHAGGPAGGDRARAWRAFELLGVAASAAPVREAR